MGAPVGLAARAVGDVDSGLGAVLRSGCSGVHALATRDFTQAEQAEEMVCLSRLRDFHVVSWRQRMDDPISEWGQLLAYLPLLRRFLGEHDSRVIFLPATTLAHGRNAHPPKEFVAEIARDREESVDQSGEAPSPPWRNGRPSWTVRRAGTPCTSERAVADDGEFMAWGRHHADAFGSPSGGSEPFPVDRRCRR